MKTKNDYWDNVNKHWDNILCLAIDHLNMEHMSFIEPGNSDSGITGRTVLEEMTYLRSIRSNKLARYFNAIWSLATDRYANSDMPSWDMLCDLCSEEYLIHEELK